MRFRVVNEQDGFVCMTIIDPNEAVFLRILDALSTCANITTKRQGALWTLQSLAWPQEAILFYDAACDKVCVYTKKKGHKKIRTDLEVFVAQAKLDSYKKGYEQQRRTVPYTVIKAKVMAWTLTYQKIKESLPKLGGGCPQAFFLFHPEIAHGIDKIFARIAITMQTGMAGETLARDIAYYESGACDAWLLPDEREKINRDITLIRLKNQFPEESVTLFYAKEWTATQVTRHTGRLMSEISGEDITCTALITGLDEQEAQVLCEGCLLEGTLRVQNAFLVGETDNTEGSPPWIRVRAKVLYPITERILRCEVEGLGRVTVCFLYMVEADDGDEIEFCGELLLATLRKEDMRWAKVAMSKQALAVMYEYAPKAAKLIGGVSEEETQVIIWVKRKYLLTMRDALTDALEKYLTGEEYVAQLLLDLCDKIQQTIYTG